jgi:hypothetical protein
MASRARPKASFNKRMADGNYLGIAVWPGKTEPEAEVIAIQIRSFYDGKWETLERMAIYRNPQGEYRALPERRESKEPETPVSESE